MFFYDPYLLALWVDINVNSEEQKGGLPENWKKIDILS